MSNKRGQGISMEFIIIAALALIALIVIVLFFTGALGKIFGQQKEVYATATEKQKEMWTAECNAACSLGGQNPYFFCTHVFEVRNDKGTITEAWVCNTAAFSGKWPSEGTQKSLDVPCKDIQEKNLCANIKA
ncbi:MAG: hypothetical protein QW404_00115 [Candidatus Nanoarchaeia archaeon]